jgi:hypothetical protein
MFFFEMEVETPCLCIEDAYGLYLHSIHQRTGKSMHVNNRKPPHNIYKLTNGRRKYHHGRMPYQHKQHPTN